MIRHLLALALLLLAGCAGTPAFESLPPTSAPPPYQVMEQPERWIDAPVVWGGMIIEMHNYAHHSEIELLAFPLDARQQPEIHLADQGRFFLILPGFAEPQEYPLGRFLSLVGRITGERRGSLRGEPYVWPEVDADRLHLWPRDFREQSPRFSIGIGVRL